MKTYFTQLSSAMCILALVICSLPMSAASKPQLTLPSAPSAGREANCSADAGKQLADRLSTLGRLPQNNPLLAVKRSVLKGLPVEYVSSATGDLSFAVTDISFEGGLPLFFQRIYSSDNSEDHGLGRGWNFIFNEKIEANVFEAVLTTAGGEKYEFDGEGLVIEKTGNREKFVLRNQEPAATQSFIVYNQKLIKETASFAEKTYEKYGEAFFLTEIRIPGGEVISLRRAKDGKLTKISSRTGEINLKWTNGNLGSVSDKAGRKVFFTVKNGFLEKVKSASGNEWHFEYQKGKLSRLIDPSGSVKLKALYNEDQKVAELGDETGTKSFSYKWNGAVSTRTSVTDAERRIYHYEQTETGLTTAISDKNGVIAALEYDSANRLARLTDAAKRVAAFGYDEMGNLISQKIPDEPVKTFEYDARGRISAVGNDAARTEFTYNSAGALRQSKSIDTDRVVTAMYNRFGKLDSVQSENSTLRFLYDAGGRETARVYGDGERFEREYDAAGRLRLERLPEGRTVKYVYNADGKIIRQSDNQGNEVRADYDAVGLLSKVSGLKGWTRAVRDRAGRITGLENSAGQKREFRYDANGALIEFTNAKGETFKYFYTERGKLKGAANSKGTAVEYKLDAAGNAIAAKRYKFDDLAKVSFADIGYEPKAAQTTDIYNCGELGFLDEFGKTQPLMMGMTLPPEAIPACSDPFYGLEQVSGIGSSFGGGFGWGFPEDKDCREDLGCISAGTGCLLAVVGYRALTLALIAACPETAGVGCIAALLTYFGGSIASAAVCSQAIIECSKPKCN